ncbi:MAG: SAM-dependent methyltransferase, partial [Chloroflexi bacterium]|nr:SAM-dependent methyltransferase [Chloroflexota bacterium]
MPETTAPDPKKLMQKVALLAGMMTGAHVSIMVVLGMRLGLYKALAGAGRITPEDLARGTGLNERWLREWLRGQAAAGVIDYASNGTFALSPEVALLLADEDQLSYLGGNFLPLPQRAAMVDRLMEAFRTGIGYSFDDRGVDAAVTTEGLFRNWYRQVLVPTALPMLCGTAAPAVGTASWR